MSPNIQRSTQNFILNALPQEDFERLSPHLEPIELAQNQVLYHPNDLITHLYFLEDSTASSVAVTPHGQSAEVGVVGLEGVVGIEALLGKDSTQNQNIIRLAGAAFCIKSEIIKEEFKKGGVLHDLTLLFACALMSQISQASMCHRLHSIEERLACRLLLFHDRAHSDRLPFTYELLFSALGISSPNVKNAAITLQSERLIVYFRGQINILDRKGLEDFTCDCYSIITREYRRLRR